MGTPIPSRQNRKKATIIAIAARTNTSPSVMAIAKCGITA